MMCESLKDQQEDVIPLQAPQLASRGHEKYSR